MADTVTLAAAVADATKTVDEATEDKKDVKPDEVSPDKKDESKELDEDDKKRGEEEELTLQGKQLVLALRDPEKAAVVIKFLAEQAGYSKVETKAEAKEAKDEVVEALKESLGDEFGFLADKLGPAITKILESKLTKHTQDIRQSLEQQQIERLEVQSATILTDLTKEYFDKEELPEPVVAEMSRLMDVYKPGPSSTPKEYLNDMFKMAVANKELPRVRNSKRVEQNRTDAASRLASERAAGEPSGSNASSRQSLSLNDAVKQAVEAANKGN